MNIVVSKDTPPLIFGGFMFHSAPPPLIFLKHDRVYRQRVPGSAAKYVSISSKVHGIGGGVGSHERLVEVGTRISSLKIPGNLQQDPTYQDIIYVL